MPTITIAIEELTKRGVDKSKAAHLIDKMGLSVEKISDKEITIEVTPNRPDLLESNGIARALKLLEGKATPKENQYCAVGKPLLKIKVGKGVKKVRPFIAGLVAKGVNLKGNSIKEIMNFQEKLHDTYGRKRRKMGIGMYDLDKIEGDITYDASKDGKMMPLGTNKVMSFAEVVKFAGDENRSQIIGQYKTYPHVSDGKKVLALIPVLLSEETKISEDTKNIFVDVTGTSEQTVNDTINMLACLLQDSGATIHSCELISAKGSKITPTLAYKEFKMSIKTIEKTIGFEIHGDDGIVLANRMGYVAGKYATDKLLFLVPPYRTDVLDERDIIEDMGIAFGYEKIRPIPVFGSAVAVPYQLTEYSNVVCSAMVGLGYSEAMSTYLTNEKQCFEMVRRKFEPNSIVKVTYSKTETISILRDSVLPSLLASLSVSSQSTMPQRLFEAGSIFNVKMGKVKEGHSLGIVSEHARSNFAEIKASVASVLKLVGVSKFDVKEESDGAFIAGRCASVWVDGERIGIFGEIHPEVLSNFKIEEPVAAAELDLDKLAQK